MPGKATPYEIGVMDDDEIGAFLVTPQDILDKMNEVKAEADKINATVSTDPAIRPEFKVAWGAWYGDVWNKFYEGHTGVSGWFSRLTGSVMTQAESHMERVKQWRAALESELGRKLAGPSLPDAPGEIPWKWILYGGVAIGAVVAVGYAARGIRGVAEDLI